MNGHAGTAAAVDLSDAQLLRYARHVMLDGIGIEGQQKLLTSRALIVGAGGLGSPVALYLGSAGVGHLTVVDDDHVDETNLQRQIAHDLSRLGWDKALSVRHAVAQLNPDVVVEPVVRRVDQAWLEAAAARHDVVLDCSDNFATRQAINAACVRSGTPLVAGAAIGYEGQLTTLTPRDPASPCWACIFPPTLDPGEQRCATLGVLAPLVGMLGSMQAAEALKLLTGSGRPLVGRLLLVDSRAMTVDSIQVARDPQCAVCAARPA